MATSFLPIGPGAVDAFARICVSTPSSLFSHKQIYDDGTPLFMIHDVAGAGASVTYDITNARSILTCGTTAAGKATRQTKRYFNYQAGKSSLVAITFNFRGAEANCEKRVGFFDNANGIYLALPASGTPVFVRRTSSSAPVISVAQSAWNIDKLNGTGPSGITLDLTKAQILVIDFQWLGVGTVRCGFYFNGAIVYAHAFHSANVESFVYIQTPNLPMRWEIVGTGVNPASPVLDAICCSIMSEGGQEPVGIQRGTARSTALAVLAGVATPLLSIRLNAAHNRATVFTQLFDMASTTAGARATLELVLNPVLTGATFAVAPANSAVEADLAATVAAGGHVLAVATIGDTSGAQVLVFQDIPAALLAADFAGTTRDHLTIRATSIANESWIASINWRELL